MSAVSMLVPFSGQGEQRVRVWSWLERYWRAHWPELELIVEPGDGKLPFGKAQAVNAAARRSTGDVLLITDADVLLSSVGIARVRRAIWHLESRAIPWSLPWSTSPRLTEADTDALLAGDPAEPVAITQAMRHRAVHWTNDATGNMQAIRRADFFMVFGYDERYRGWGGDDYSFAMACDTLVGSRARARAELVQLHHPRQDAADGSRPIWEGETLTAARDELLRRYLAASGNRDAMRKLVAE